MRTSHFVKILQTSTLAVALTACMLPCAAQAVSKQSLGPETDACPVHIAVDRNSGLVTREVEGKQIPTAAGLILHFQSPADRAIVAADLIVHGYDGRVIAQPLETAAASELTEDFHLTATGADSLSRRSIWTQKIAGVVWVELTRVTFRDGSSWQRSVPGECRIEPSLMVLVNATTAR